VERHPLPCPHVLAELASEVREHERIRRKFIFDAYRDRTPTELFIAVMAWGLGLSNYGPSRARRMLLQPNAGKAIEAVVNAVRQDGAAAGYSTYYTEGNTLEGLNVSFITKLIHFAGYESEHGHGPSSTTISSPPPSLGCPQPHCCQTSRTSPPPPTSGTAGGPRTRRQSTEPNLPWSSGRSSPSEQRYGTSSGQNAPLDAEAIGKGQIDETDSRTTR
jgi:Putative 8-oxoguanine DNA glycosylase OGG-like protein